MYCIRCLSSMFPLVKGSGCTFCAGQVVHQYKLNKTHHSVQLRWPVPQDAPKIRAERPNKS